MCYVEATKRRSQEIIMAAAQLKEVLVIGGTGAQGLPVVNCQYLSSPHLMDIICTHDF